MDASKLRKFLSVADESILLIEVAVPGEDGLPPTMFLHLPGADVNYDINEAVRAVPAAWRNRGIEGPTVLTDGWRAVLYPRDMGPLPLRELVRLLNGPKSIKLNINKYQRNTP